MSATPQDEKNELAERTILKDLSVNGRKSIGAIARKLKMPKATVYQIYNKTVEKYGLKFVPELAFEEAWRVELLQAFKRKGTKRELREEVLGKVPEIGFQEYLIFVKFNGKEPHDEELKAALGDSHLPQYVGKVQGGNYNILMYAVTRTYLELEGFIATFGKKLKKYPLTISATKIFVSFGYFPLRNDIIEKINVPS
ncbi:MAG: hypothetical protein KGH52_00885, partial [Candidatus Micrarchaeota archaeon]|nr:hypothetical protein [Candidatus Micrarchaeota archaeon]